MHPVDLHAAYVRERFGADVEIDGHKGFATWRMQQLGVHEAQASYGKRDAYLIDIYVAPDFRQAGVATALCERVTAKAKAQGATRLLGSVETQAATRTLATKAILAAGFEVTHLAGTVIWFAKEIG